tara:strand:- start:1136 stop:1714 length:579 start_codon:yes stop_codon:yes gene_type:complete
MKINGNGKATALSFEQFQALLEIAPSPKHRALWAVQYYCAARIGESLSLTWQSVTGGHVTFKAGTTKTKVTRQPVIHPELQTELDAYRQWWTNAYGAPKGVECLFHTSDSLTQPMSRQAADKALKASCKQIGVQGVSTHTFRRSAAQRVVAAGVPVFQAMAVTGHKSISAFQEYIDQNASDLVACHQVLGAC